MCITMLINFLWKPYELSIVDSIDRKYMKHGISVWLDVPLEALARRIAAVGTDSRPLLHYEPGDPYTKVTFSLLNSHILFLI